MCKSCVARAVFMWLCAMSRGSQSVPLVELVEVRVGAVAGHRRRAARSGRAGQSVGCIQAPFLLLSV